VGQATLPRGGYWVLVAAVLVVAAYMPWLGSRYHVSFMFFLCLHLAMTATFDIVGGYMGYINLGHGAFFGIGAYVYGMAVVRWGVPVLGLGLATLAAGVFAALIAVPVLRLRGVYFAIATFGILKLMDVLAANLDGLTGGTPGLSIPPTASTLPTFYLMLAAAVAAVALNVRVATSRLGLGLVSLREDEEVAEASGIATRRLKRLVFVLSALVPGFAGGVYMWQLTYINPTTAFGFEMSFPPVIMAMLGGTGTIAGPVVGTIFLTLIEEVLWARLGYLQLAMYGAVLVLVGIVMPGGLMRSRLGTLAYRALAIPDHYGYRSGPSRS
jgi:branched-chain amino acid transport system permease protein